MSLFRSASKSKRVLIFHIGSGNIIAAHVLLQPHKDGVVPEVLHSVVMPMPVTLDVKSSDLVQVMSQTLHKAAERMVLEKIGSPDEIICFLESPWYAAQVRTIRMSKNVPFLITPKLVKDLVKKETDLFEREVVAPYKESGNESMIIEREMTDIRLNGYPVSDPYGQKVKEISLGIVISISPRSLLLGIQKTISNVFHRKDIKFQTFAYAGSMITRDLFMTHNTFLFTDIGGEMTDIVLVKDDAYIETVSFPSGTHTVLRSFAKKMNISLDNAHSILSLYTGGKMEALLMKKIEKNLEPIMQEWTQSFEKSLGKLATQFAIPHTVALIVEPGMLQLFKQAVLNESFAQHTLTSQAFSIVPLSEVPWQSFAHHTVPTHPRSSIAALLVAKHMSNNRQHL